MLQICHLFLENLESRIVPSQTGVTVLQSSSSSGISTNTNDSIVDSTTTKSLVITKDVGQGRKLIAEFHGVSSNPGLDLCVGQTVTLTPCFTIQDETGQIIPLAGGTLDISSPSGSLVINPTTVVTDATGCAEFDVTGFSVSQNLSESLQVIFTHPLFDFPLILHVPSVVFEVDIDDGFTEVLVGETAEVNVDLIAPAGFVHGFLLRIEADSTSTAEVFISNSVELESGLNTITVTGIVEGLDMGNDIVLIVENEFRNFPGSITSIDECDRQGFSVLSYEQFLNQAVNDAKNSLQIEENNAKSLIDTTTQVACTEIEDGQTKEQVLTSLSVAQDDLDGIYSNSIAGLEIIRDNALAELQARSDEAVARGAFLEVNVLFDSFDEVNESFDQARNSVRKAYHEALVTLQVKARHHIRDMRRMDVTPGFLDMYVWDIDFESRDRGNKHDTRVIVTIRQDSDGDGVAEASDALVSGAKVSVVLDGPKADAFQGTTNKSGIYRTPWITNVPDGNYLAEVITLTHKSLVWNLDLDPTDNDTDEDDDNLPDQDHTV